MSNSARIPLVAGNWKMNLLRQDAAALAAAVKQGVSALQGVEVAVCPAFTALESARVALQGGSVALGAQDVYTKESGAFTGEVSPGMLIDAGCAWVIVGHSERRHVLGESDDFLNEKLRFALESGLKVMFCIGELLEERESNAMEQVLERQVSRGLAGLTAADLSRVVLAYEPVWAIGTGKTASPAQAEEAHVFVRGLVRKLFGDAAAEAMRIQYGGSVKPENAAELAAQPNVDGFLVGGAALKAESFVPIVKACAQA